MFTLLMADAGEVERAVEFYAGASWYSKVGKSEWRDDFTGPHIADAAANLTPEVLEAAVGRGI